MEVRLPQVDNAKALGQQEETRKKQHVHIPIIQHIKFRKWNIRRFCSMILLCKMKTKDLVRHRVKYIIYIIGVLRSELFLKTKLIITVLFVASMNSITQIQLKKRIYPKYTFFQLD